MNYHSNGWCGTRSRRKVMELEDEAANLIKVQHSLQNFELHQCEVGSTAIIQSLQTQSNLYDRYVLITLVFGVEIL